MCGFSRAATRPTSTTGSSQMLHRSHNGRSTRSPSNLRPCAGTRSQVCCRCSQGHRGGIRRSHAETRSRPTIFVSHASRQHAHPAGSSRIYSCGTSFAPSPPPQLLNRIPRRRLPAALKVPPRLIAGRLTAQLLEQRRRVYGLPVCEFLFTRVFVGSTHRQHLSTLNT